MSATLDYLRALRRRQLGEPDIDIETFKPESIEALERAARAENASAMKGARPRRPQRHETRLHLTRHARQRMAQRGLSVGDVYAIYLHGEPQGDPDGRTRYVLTERALVGLDGHRAKQLRRLAGTAIVVAPPDGEGLDPALITVLR